MLGNRQYSYTGYNGHRYGVLLDQDHQFESFRLGWYGGYEKANTHFNGTSDGRQEDVNTYMLGLQGEMTFEHDIFANATTVSVTTKDKSTSGSFDAGMSLVNNNGITSDLRITGEANSDRTDYTKWINLGYSF